MSLNLCQPVRCVILCHFVLQCTVTCGSGIQTRFVECPESDRCDPDEKPDDEMTCDTGECRDLVWVEGSWSEVRELISLAFRVFTRLSFRLI